MATDKFSKKKSIRELVANSDSQESQLKQLQQAVVAVYQKLFQVEKTSQNQRRIDDVLDLRTRAVMSLLEKVGITESDIKAKINDLQVENFDRQSAEDDKRRNLEPAEGPAEKGHIATTTILVYKDGVEVEDERVVRSKVELGKAEFLQEVDDAVIGMQVGETKEFPLSLQGKTDTAKLTLLALSKAKTEETPAEPAAE